MIVSIAAIQQTGHSLKCTSLLFGTAFAELTSITTARLKVMPLLRLSTKIIPFKTIHSFSCSPSFLKGREIQFYFLFHTSPQSTGEYQNFSPVTYWIMGMYIKSDKGIIHLHICQRERIKSSESHVYTCFWQHSCLRRVVFKKNTKHKASFQK